MTLGPHGTFIVLAYGATGVILAALFLHAALDHRAQARTLAGLEARGVRRRSQPASAGAADARPARDAVG